MNERPQRKTVRLSCFDYNAPCIVFVTICTENRRSILSRVVGTGVLDGPHVELTKYGEIADKYIRQMSDFYTHLTVENYVIMPNHIHLLLRIENGVSENGPSRTSENGPSRTPENGPSRTPVPTVQNSALARFVSTFKRFCNKEYGVNIWQRRSYDHIIRNQQDYDEHWRYIDGNPARWLEEDLYTP